MDDQRNPDLFFENRCPVRQVERVPTLGQGLAVIRDHDHYGCLEIERTQQLSEDLVLVTQAGVVEVNVLVRVLEGAWEPSAVSDPDSASFTLLHRTIREVFPDVLVAPYLLPGATDARHYAGLAESPLRFIPQWLTRGDLKRVHGVSVAFRLAGHGVQTRAFRTSATASDLGQQVNKGDRAILTQAPCGSVTNRTPEARAASASWMSARRR